MADQTLDLGAYLARLELQRTTLNIQIAGAREAMGLPPEDGAEAPNVIGGGTVPVSSGTSRPTTGQVRSDEFFRMSIPEAVKRYLEIMKQPQSPTDIVGALKRGGVLSESKNFYTTVWTALKRLRKAGDIVNTRSGWGLSDWYPNKPRAGNEDKKAPKNKGKKPSRPKGKKSAKASAKPRVAAETAIADTPTVAAGWKAFLADQLKAGRSMKEASESWKKRKAGA